MVRNMDRFQGSTPWTRLWYVPPMNRARRDAGSRLRVALYRADTPGATQHQSDCRVRFKHRLQDRNPFEKSVSCSLIRTHVDALAGMPEHFFMVDNTIEVQIQSDIRAAGSRRREIRGVLARGHSRRHSAWCQLVSGDSNWSRPDSRPAHSLPMLTSRHRIGLARASSSRLPGPPAPSSHTTLSRFASAIGSFAATRHQWRSAAESDQSRRN